MTKIIFILLCCANFLGGLSAQNPEKSKLLCPQDFEIDNGRAVVTDIPCNITSDNPFLVSVICQQPVFKEIGIEKINELILLGYQRAKNTVDIEHSYIPTEIRMSYNPAVKSWSVTNLFSIKRADGNVSTTMLAMDFDATGKSLGIKRIY